MNDTSRALRYELGSLCERYNTMVADKDALDVRLGSPHPYEQAEIDPERIYEAESQRITSALRDLIAEIVDVGRRIREIEDF